MAKVRKFVVDILKTVFPTTIWELSVLLFFIVGYGILATEIALNYRIVFDNRIPWDAYFSFDNRSIVLTGGGFERHPLSNYFFDKVCHLALWFSGGKFNADFRLALAWFSTIAVSFALLQIFKYLKNIIGLPVGLAVLLVLFAGMFSTSILLSFTPETYTYTFLLLTLYNYFAALKLRNGKKIPLSAMTLFSVGIGGLTITNIVKTYIPVLFEKNLFRSWKKILNALMRVMVSSAVFILLYLNRLNFDVQKIFTKTETQYEKFSQPKHTPIWDMIFSWFFGGNMLFSGLITRDYHNQKGFQYKALFMDVYTEIWQYLFVGIVLLLVIWAWMKNRKNALVNILMLSFCIDIAIHCVLKFGLHTSYIYGGHFVFVYPLMLGWLFYAYRNNVKIFSALVIVFSVLVVYLGLNNYFRMEDFFRFLEMYYQ